MGTWIYFADQGNSGMVGSGSTYTIAHNLAEGVWLGASNAVQLGQSSARVGAIAVLRSKIQFPTLTLPIGAEITSASLYMSFFASLPSGKNVTVHILDGSGLSSSIIALPDYGTLHSLTTSLGAITIPDGGITPDEYNEIVLNATGIAAINKTSWTKLGLRSSDDISATAPANVGEYVQISHGDGSNMFAPMFSSTITGGAGKITFSSQLVESNLVEDLLTKLIVTTDDSLSGSEFDVCFAYGTTPPSEGWTPDYYTPWELNYPLDTVFTTRVTNLPAGTYYVAPVMRYPHVEFGTQTYYTHSPDTVTVSTVREPGYIWIESDEFHYIDADNTERICFGLGV